MNTTNTPTLRTHATHQWPEEWYDVTAVEQLKAQLAEMTEDRNLWRDAHCEDGCPATNRAEIAEAQLAEAKVNWAHCLNQLAEAQKPITTALA